MKKIIALAVAFAAIAIVAGPEASAQSFSFNNGYQFGAGANAGGLNLGHRNRGFGFGGIISRGVNRPARPPYFAEFPPVYYNGIVRRPYGISPYAAPAGIRPVEMNHAPEEAQPATVRNPFFNKNKNTPVSVMEEDKTSTDNKSTQVFTNPHFNAIPEADASVMHASFETLE
jgi:hypothetical protein